MARKVATVKPLLLRVQPIPATVSEPVVVSASPTPTLSTERSEPTPLSPTVGSVRSRVEPVEKSVERRHISKLAKQRVNVVDSQPTPVLESAYPQSPAMLLLAGSHITPGTPPQPILSQRDPLVLLDKPVIPSARTAKIIGQRWKVRAKFRPPTKECEDAGLGPGAKSVDLAPKLDSYGMPLPKLREWN